MPRYRSARVSPASGVALGPAGPAADSRGRRRVVQPSALHMCPDPDPRLTTNADRAFHVGMANDKQPRHDNLKARCLPQATSPLHGCSPGVPFVHHPLPYALLYFHPAASLPASIARLWKVRDTTRELRVFPGIMPVCFWAECHIIGLHVLRPTWIMSQAGQRAVSFHALVVLLLALVTTAGALTQSIGNTGDFDALQSYAPVLALPETYIICFAPTHSYIRVGAQVDGGTQHTTHTASTNMGRLLARVWQARRWQGWECDVFGQTVLASHACCDAQVLGYGESLAPGVRGDCCQTNGFLSPAQGRWNIYSPTAR